MVICLENVLNFESWDLSLYSAGSPKLPILLHRRPITPVMTSLVLSISVTGYCARNVVARTAFGCTTTRGTTWTIQNPSTGRRPPRTPPLTSSRAATRLHRHSDRECFARAGGKRRLLRIVFCWLPTTTHTHTHRSMVVDVCIYIVVIW